MSHATLVPPLKCQGIKTKLAPEIQRLAMSQQYERWIEPFCGSCVVALNVQPRRALLCDTNLHIIRLYREIQDHTITAAVARSFLTEQGETLRAKGEDYYYEVRERFNAQPNSLDFLFLNRSCFNGVIRFNKSGKFNVPFGHKPERFIKAYVTKIANQIRRIAEVIGQNDWEFSTSDFRETLQRVASGDFVYCDPPYAGRHSDYFNAWSEEDELELCDMLRRITGRFLLSTWHSNRHRTNPSIETRWREQIFHTLTRKHFYHVGASEALRNEMLEALIMNFPPPVQTADILQLQQADLFKETFLLQA